MCSYHRQPIHRPISNSTEASPRYTLTQFQGWGPGFCHIPLPVGCWLLVGHLPPTTGRQVLASPLGNNPRKATSDPHSCLIGVKGAVTHTHTLHTLSQELLVSAVPSSVSGAWQVPDHTCSSWCFIIAHIHSASIHSSLLPLTSCTTGEMSSV